MSTEDTVTNGTSGTGKEAITVMSDEEMVVQFCTKNKLAAGKLIKVRVYLAGSSQTCEA